MSGRTYEAHRLARGSVNLASGRQVWLLGPPDGFNIYVQVFFLLINKERLLINKERLNSPKKGGSRIMCTQANTTEC
jgi:hypothetical protein